MVLLPKLLDHIPCMDCSLMVLALPSAMIHMPLWPLLMPMHLWWSPRGSPLHRYIFVIRRYSFSYPPWNLKLDPWLDLSWSVILWVVSWRILRFIVLYYIRLIRLRNPLDLSNLSLPLLLLLLLFSSPGPNSFIRLAFPRHRLELGSDPSSWQPLLLFLSWSLILFIILH